MKRFIRSWKSSDSWRVITESDSPVPEGPRHVDVFWKGNKPHSLRINLHGDYVNVDADFKRIEGFFSRFPDVFKKSGVEETRRDGLEFLKRRKPTL